MPYDRLGVQPFGFELVAGRQTYIQVSILSQDRTSAGIHLTHLSSRNLRLCSGHLSSSERKLNANRDRQFSLILPHNDSSSVVNMQTCRLLFVFLSPVILPPLFS